MSNNNLYLNEELLLQLLDSGEFLEMFGNINNNNQNNVRTFQLTFPSYWTQNRSIQDVIEETMNAKPVFKYIISEEGKELLKEEVYDISNDVDKTNSNMCPISLVEFEKDEKLIRLPCNHLFNKENILNWLEKEKSECPVCRYQLPSTEVRNEDHTTQTTSNENENNNQENNENEETLLNDNESYEEEIDNDDELFDFIDSYEQRQILINRLTLLDRLIGHQF